MITSHRTVMHHDSEGTYWVMFRQPHEREQELDESIMLCHDLWREMGSPRIITVTIEPGDLLNVE